MTQNIEVEIRSFISAEQYSHFLEFFTQQGQFLHADEQVSYYFDGKEDLRIQKNNFYSKVWLKKGQIHDPQREELEVKFPREEFENLERLFLALGYTVGVKWFRQRHQFLWEGITVSVDYTQGYGYIIELEMMASPEKQDEVLRLLRRKLEELGIKETSKEVFNQKFQWYKEHWREVV